jgi:hypothetical protein
MNQTGQTARWNDFFDPAWRFESAVGSAIRNPNDLAPFTRVRSPLAKHPVALRQSFAQFKTLNLCIYTLFVNCYKLSTRSTYSF